MDKNSFLFKSGEFAEEEAVKFCIAKGYEVEKANNYWQRRGVDLLYIKDKKVITVDVKSTSIANVCNIHKGRSKSIISVRHPFKANTDADELWVWDKFRNDWEYQGSKDKYLERFFFDINAKNRFLNKLKSIDKKEDNSIFPMKDLKEELKAYIYKTFLTVQEDDDQITLKMVTLKDKKYLEQHGKYVHK